MKRRKADRRRLMKKVAKRLPLGSVNPDYYEATDIRIKASRVYYRVKPNAKYKALMVELIGKCTGVEVKLPNTMRPIPRRPML